MTNETINDDTNDLQALYKNILQRVANLNVSIIRVRNELRKFMAGLPFEEANEIANLNINLGRLHNILDHELHQLEDKINQKTKGDK